MSCHEVTGESSSLNVMCTGSTQSFLTVAVHLPIILNERNEGDRHTSSEGKGMERKRKGKGQGEAKGKGPIKEMRQDQFIFEMSVVKGKEEGKGKNTEKQQLQISPKRHKIISA